MSDPRINPNYKGVKCPGCGERLPFLLTDLCSHCTHERDRNEIERLKADFKTAFDEAWKRGCEIERLQKRNALLEDVAATADALTYADAVAGAETWGEMKEALNKLREVSDE